LVFAAVCAVLIIGRTAVQGRRC